MSRYIMDNSLETLTGCKRPIACHIPTRCAQSLPVHAIHIHYVIAIDRFCSSSSDTTLRGLQSRRSGGVPMSSLRWYWDSRNELGTSVPIVCLSGSTSEIDRIEKKDSNQR